MLLETHDDCYWLHLPIVVATSFFVCSGWLNCIANHALTKRLTIDRRGEALGSVSAFNTALPDLDFGLKATLIRPAMTVR